jgi:hypothetical protein
MARAHSLGSASGSFSRRTHVSSEEWGDEGTIVSNRWRIAGETEPSDWIGRKWHSTASSAN